MQVKKHNNSLTASQIDQESPVEMLVVDECGVDPRAGGVVDAEVVKLSVPAEQVALLLVQHQLLDQLGLLQHVQVEPGRGLASPGRERVVVKWGFG